MNESPFNTDRFDEHGFLFNWTAYYGMNSTIPIPNGKWIYYNNSIKSSEQSVNYAEGKSHQVAWLVSHCKTRNKRLAYAKELQKYISVDIYGDCGTKNCSRRDRKICFEMLKKKYKFYLAFENSICRFYITEKFFKNALSNNVIPIVMGAKREDYELIGPRNSYIHVDDFSNPKELAEYLLKLDQNDTLYNEYFQWKGTGYFLKNTKYLCRICALLHAPDIATWSSRNEYRGHWNRDQACINGSWGDKIWETKLTSEFTTRWQVGRKRK